jgi:hypothetical protein
MLIPIERAGVFQVLPVPQSAFGLRAQSRRSNRGKNWNRSFALAGRGGEKTAISRVTVKGSGFGQLGWRHHRGRPGRRRFHRTRKSCASPSATGSGKGYPRGVT